MKVLIAEDHPVYRDGIRQLIEAEEQLSLVHETADGAEALERIRLLQPDVAVLDINLPGLGGLDIARTCYREQLEIEIVFLTMYRDPDIFKEAVNLGVKGFVLKDSTSSEIAAAILAVSSGQTWYSPSLGEFFRKQQSENKGMEDSFPGFEKLTPTERKVLRMIASDRTTKEIAAEFGISPRTIDNHRAHICGKLGIRGSHKLLKFAFENRYRL